MDTPDLRLQFSLARHHRKTSNSLLKKASNPVIAGAARDFSSPKANKKRDSISHHYPE
jgi:hypothetical protein